MRHSQPVASQLPTEDDLLQILRSQVAVEGRPALARRLGLTPFRLAQILRGRWPIPDDVAAQLGFRRVVRFEPLDG